MSISKYTPEKRLALYQQALKDYRKLDNDNCRETGLCLYFSQVHGIIGVYCFLHKVLPELQETKPGSSDTYWFEAGAKAPRIRCLQEAIKITKERYNLK